MKKIFIVSLVLLLMTVITDFAGATDITAKAFGMGGAFTGIANDFTSVIYNPAGLSQSGFGGLQFNGAVFSPEVDKVEELLSISDHINDDQYDVIELLEQFLAGAQFDGQALLGVNLKSFGMAVNFNNHFESTKEITEEINEAVLDNISLTEGIISFGHELGKAPFNLSSLSYGLNLKMIRSDYINYKVALSGSTSEIVANGNGFGLDLGVLAKLTDLITLGAQVRNLWASEYEITGEETRSEYDDTTEGWEETAILSFSRKEKPERVMRIGASVYVPMIKATIAADIDNFPLLTDKGRKEVFHLGLEKNLLFNGLSLRAGTFKQAADPRYYTFGLGVNLWKLHLDAAVGSNDQFKDNITGVLAANIKF